MGIFHVKNRKIIREGICGEKEWEEVLLQTQIKATISLRAKNRKSTLINLGQPLEVLND